MNTKNQEQFISKENKKRILLGVNALLMVVLIVVATYAWFSRNTVDDVKVNEIAFQGSSDLEVSLDDSEYAFSRTLTFNSSSLAQDITGNGLPSSFVRPSIAPSSGNATLSVPNTKNTSAWKTSLSGEDNIGQTQSSDYKIKTIYFRSKKAMTVYLGDGSQVLGAAEVNGKKLVGPSNKDDVGNKSTVKDVKDDSNSDVSVSKDCIVGATRFAFLNNAADTVNCIWIPRPNIFYETKKNSEGKDVKTIYGGTSSTLANLGDSKDNTQAYPSPTTHYYYDATVDNETQKVTSASLQTAANAIAGSTDLSTTSEGKDKSKLVVLTKASESEPYYKGSINVVIWVEGCDAEARQAFAGGKFGGTLRFVGIEN